MGVFKWLRRERVTLTTHSVPPAATTPEHQNHSKSTSHIGTIRTEEYKRDLAEFQARRSANKELPDTPVKKKSGRHSLPVSCADCATSHDNTFNYEKKSAIKYKKKVHKRARSTNESPDLPNIQFLFQNQVFMPGNMFSSGAFSEPPRSKRHTHRFRVPEFETVQKQIDFDADQSDNPLFYRNNSLPFDVKNFLEGRGDEEEVDGVNAAGDVKVSSQGSFGSSAKDDACEEKLWEVMSELKHFDQWADEQLQSQNTSKSDDSKSDTSAYGLPIASVSNLNVDMDRNKVWNEGKWGVVPVQIKKLSGVTIQHVRKKLSAEINILRKCRHPNIILLMGLYPDVHRNIHIICERCVDTLFGILHVQGSILSVQTAVQYALDIANALLFLQMQGYIHTELSSTSVMVTGHGTAKLADLGPCAMWGKPAQKREKSYEMYSPEPQYVNIEDTRATNSPESEPLISTHPSEVYLSSNAVAKEYKTYRHSEMYRWQAPELYEPDELGRVHVCSKSDVYSLCLILWESCNAAVPFKTFTYENLKESYISWQTGLPLPQDGTYPGCLLALLQSGLTLSRSNRIDLATLQKTLQNVKRNVDDLDYIILPARPPKKKTTFSSTAWDTSSPTDESECLSPAQNVQHKAVIHTRESSSESSEKDCSKSEGSPLYEIIRKEKYSTQLPLPQNSYTSDDENAEYGDIMPIMKYEHLQDQSTCSTPIAKLKERIKDMESPGALHRSDSTEYCSIMSPDNRNFIIHDDGKAVERPTAKLSKSFTPKSYKPLHIKVPEVNLDSVKSILKETVSSEKSSYNFDIKNYSLPSTPIARSNKLRKNAWLSGELTVPEKCAARVKDIVKTSSNESKSRSAPETPVISMTSSLEKEESPKKCIIPTFILEQSEDLETTPEKNISSHEELVIRDSFTGLRRVMPQEDLYMDLDNGSRENTSSLSFKTADDQTAAKLRVEDDELANVNVKPLVAIHERWIYEANKKTGRSMSLPENNRCHISALKPASHCVDTLQKSLPQLNLKRAIPKPFRTHPVSPVGTKNGFQWEQFCQARETIAKNVNFSAANSDRHKWKRDSDKGITTEEARPEPKVDQATDTRSIEEFIRDLIRKECQHLLHEMSDDTSIITAPRNEEILNKGVANVVDNLRNGKNVDMTLKKDPIKSFSRVKINGNNKPLLQITFTRSGENSLQVLDNCVNVTICDSAAGREKVNISMEDTLTPDEVQVHSLKRCQAFNAIQEARSTEDLYIDDDLSTQMQENFGGKVKLIPLHGSLHELLCEKEDECCLIKVKQENGCDTIYFRCDNSDTESRDAIDGCMHDSRPQDTVVYKRSISLVEERIQRIIPKEKRMLSPLVCRRPDHEKEKSKHRPKSEIFPHVINKETRSFSNSSPSLIMKGDKTDEVEVNLENAMCYQDSSSDECLKAQIENDDFEILERKIEEDLATNKSSGYLGNTCGYLDKISEENLSVLNEDTDQTERFMQSAPQ